jgi:hypothetical protein
VSEHYPNLTPETLDVLRDAIPKADALVERALKAPNMKIVFGTDAVADAHGQNITATQRVMFVMKDGIILRNR